MAIAQRWMTKTQAAEYMGCSRETVYRLLERGCIRQSPKRDGLWRRVDRLSIDEFMEGAEDDQEHEDAREGQLASADGQGD